MQGEFRSRPRRTEERWTDDPFMVFTVIASAIVFAAFVIWAAAELRARYELQQLTMALQQQTAKINRDMAATTLRAAARADAMRPPATVTVHVPGRDPKECLAQTNGVANPEYVRCRNGYTETRLVRH